MWPSDRSWPRRSGRFLRANRARLLGPPLLLTYAGGSTSTPRSDASSEEDDMDTDEPAPELTVTDDSFAEQFPLSPLDDYMIHQTPDPIRVMWTSDPRAYERYWMVCHDPAGEVLIATGGSFYPNLDRAEAYAIVNHQAGTPPCEGSAGWAPTAPTCASDPSHRASSGACAGGATCSNPTNGASAIESTSATPPARSSASRSRTRRADSLPGDATT